MTPEEFKNKISEISQATNDNEYVMNALKELNQAFIDVSGAPSYAKQMFMTMTKSHGKKNI